MIQEYWKEIIDFFSTQDNGIWPILLITVFATLLVSFIAGRILSNMERRCDATKNSWDDALFSSLQRPVQLVIWAYGLLFSVQLSFPLEDVVVQFMEPTRDAIFVVALAWFGLKFSYHFEKNLLEKCNDGGRLDATTVNAISKLMRLAIIITAALMMMHSLGFSVAGVMAAGGVGGLVIGLAAKDLLANFFGAMMIYLDKPFRVGDWVRSPDADIEGTVEDIGWRLTRVRTFEKRALYIPNQLFNTIVVENPSRMTHRRIKETIGVRYDDIPQVKSIAATITEMLSKHNAVDHDLTFFANLTAFNSSSVDIFVSAFTKNTDGLSYFAEKQDIMLKISDIIDDHGAEMAFPTQTLHLASTPEEVEKETTKKPAAKKATAKKTTKK